MGHNAESRRARVRTPAPVGGQPLQLRGNPSTAPTPRNPPGFAGFTYLFQGSAPQLTPGIRNINNPAHDEIMRQLAQGLPCNATWRARLRTPSGASGTLDDNPFIPSGYTYLLQFIAHDVVQTTTPFWAAADLGVDSANNRACPLMLNALYGGGPSACPQAFEPPPGGEKNEDEDRIHLRLGSLAGSDHRGGRCPMRDLPRVNVDQGIPATNRNSDSVNFEQAHSVQTADPRNDDNIILSQMVVLLSLAHNIVCDQITNTRAEARFNYARAIMLDIYHRIVGHDLLPLLLHPHVLRVMAAKPVGLWTGSGIPLEFSHGALRVGHAMVRHSYSLNVGLRNQDIMKVVMHNQQFAGGLRTPLEQRWILEWSRFFDDLGGVPNFSRRIGLRKSSLDRHDLFPTPGVSPPDGTSLRDLLSAAAAELPSVAGMINAITELHPALIPPGWNPAIPRRIGAGIQTWLQTTPLAGNAAGLTSIVNNPPLPLFILAEAEFDPDVLGRHMGVLGSIIVGEVLYRLIDGERGRLSQLKAAAANSFANGLLGETDAIDSMSGLVEFVARFGNLDACHGIPFK